MTLKSQITEKWIEYGRISRNMRKIARELGCSHIYVRKIILDHELNSDISVMLKLILANGKKIDELSGVEKKSLNLLYNRVKKGGFTLE